MIAKVLASRKDIKYIGQFDRKQLEDDGFDGLPFLDSRLNGNEVSVEYHMFEIDDNIPVLYQHRLTASPEIRKTVNDLKKN